MEENEDVAKVVKILRKDLNQLRRMPDGTVLRLTVMGSYGVTLTYAAVWITDTQKWYLTGAIAQPKTHQQFVNWLINEAVTVEVAAGWAEL